MLSLRNRLTKCLLLGALCAVPGSNCGPVYDLDQPLRLTLTEPFTAELGSRTPDIVSFISEGAIQLGTKIDDSATAPPIELRYQMDCGDDAGRGDPGWIKFCVAARAYLLPSLRFLTLHELGHALGADHIPCDGRSLMCAERWRYEAALDPMAGYSAADVAEICRHNIGGACGR